MKKAQREAQKATELILKYERGHLFSVVVTEDAVTRTQSCPQCGSREYTIVQIGK